jgi:hypothetical protein
MNRLAEAPCGHPFQPQLSPRLPSACHRLELNSAPNCQKTHRTADNRQVPSPYSSQATEEQEITGLARTATFPPLEALISWRNSGGRSCRLLLAASAMASPLVAPGSGQAHGIYKELKVLQTLPRLGNQVQSVVQQANVQKANKSNK